MACDEAIALVEANTALAAPPLCPEVRLRLLAPDAPLRRAAPRGLFADDGPRPYWAFAWGGGQALARYLLDHPETARGKRVLDFGAGSGIAAIAAAMAGAAHVAATDTDPLALAAIALNAAANGVAVSPCGEDLLKTGRADWEVLTAGDVCYLSWMGDWLRTQAGGERLVLIGDPGRPWLPADLVTELARYTVRTTPELEDPALKEAAVYCFRNLRTSVPATSSTALSAPPLP
ncbi:MAG: methyltransferase [Planctomycetes bacterium]|nr:methyltransferase [Planctomycetota bacterium]